MEMPIRIIITLFVALVVGTTLVVFSKEMISKSRDDIDKNRPGVDPTAEEESKIIQLNRVDESQMIDLMTECYNKHHGTTFERELCFAVIGKDADAWAWSDIEDYFADHDEIKANVTIRNVNDGDYAFNIYFDPYGRYETIEVSK